MNGYTFEQCLTALLKQKKIAIGELGARLGCKTELRRILNGLGSLSKREALYEKIERSGVFDAEDCAKLRASLEVNRLGPERYRAFHAFDQLFGHAVDAEPECNDEKSDLLGYLHSICNASEIEICMLNGCFPEPFAAFKHLLDTSDAVIRIKHYIQLSPDGNEAALIVSHISPILLDRRYDPVVLPFSPGTAHTFPAGNLLAIRSVKGAKTCERLFLQTDGLHLYEMKNSGQAQPLAFVNQLVESLGISPLPLKQFQSIPRDYSTFIMTLLSRELNRATYMLGNGVCFQQTPPQIAALAMLQGPVIGSWRAEALVESVYNLYEQRYRNLYTKRKPTYDVMTLDGCHRFMQTGLAADHYYAMRAFTPQERLTIFESMLNNARSNPAYTPLLLKQEHSAPRYGLVCYDRLGVTLTTSNSDYNIEKGFDYVYITYLPFVKLYMEYFHERIVSEYCMTPSESIHELEKLFEQYQAEFETDKQ